MKKTANLQDIFLTKARKQGVPLTVFLVNGFQMRGSVTLSLIHISEPTRRS